MKYSTLVYQGLWTIIVCFSFTALYFTTFPRGHKKETQLITDFLNVINMDTSLVQQDIERLNEYNQNHIKKYPYYETFLKPLKVITIWHNEYEMILAKLEYNKTLSQQDYKDINTSLNEKYGNIKSIFESTKWRRSTPEWKHSFVQINGEKIANPLTKELEIVMYREKLRVQEISLLKDCERGMSRDYLDNCWFTGMFFSNQGLYSLKETGTLQVYLWACHYDAYSRNTSIKINGEDILDFGKVLE